MVELITTKEENAAATYLEWDDEALGKFTKYVALKMEAMTLDEEGMRKVWSTAACLILVKGTDKSGAQSLTIKMENITTKDGPIGTWEIKISRIKRALARAG